MRSLWMGRREVCRQKLDYYLLAEEHEGLCESYGVEVASSGGERSAVRCVTLSQGRILLLVMTLMERCVTPLTLRDVVEDWILQ